MWTKRVLCLLYFCGSLWFPIVSAKSFTNEDDGVGTANSNQKRLLRHHSWHGYKGGMSKGKRWKSKQGGKGGRKFKPHQIYWHSYGGKGSKIGGMKHYNHNKYYSHSYGKGRKKTRGKGYHKYDRYNHSGKGYTKPQGKGYRGKGTTKTWWHWWPPTSIPVAPPTRTNAPAPTNTPTASATPDECINDQSDASTDSGCTDEDPFCVDADLAPVALGESGEVCALCINNKLDGTADLGCSDPDMPLCRDKDGNDSVPQDHGGNQCAPCSLKDGALDVCLSIDESGSIGRIAFDDIVRPFAIKLVEEIGGEVAKYAVVTFNLSADIDTELTTSAEAKETIEGLTYSGGGTDIADGIDKCVEALSGTRAGRSKVLILFTDGQTNADTSAEEAKAEEITLVTVGVAAAQEDELKKWASKDEDGDPLSYKRDEFEDLNSELVDLIVKRKVCVGY